MAAAAVRTEGDVHVRPGDGLVDLRRGVNIAVGRARLLPDMLTTHAGLVAVEPQNVQQWATDNPGRRLAVLTRNVTDDPGAVLDLVPHAVVIHVGVPGAAARAPHRVLGHGAGLASSREILTRITR